MALRWWQAGGHGSSWVMPYLSFHGAQNTTSFFPITLKLAWPCDLGAATVLTCHFQMKSFRNQSAVLLVILPPSGQPVNPISAHRLCSASTAPSLLQTTISLARVTSVASSWSPPFHTASRVKWNNDPYRRPRPHPQNLWMCQNKYKKTNQQQEAKAHADD